MNRNDVIDVLSVVAAATRRTVGDTDVDVWQAIIGDDDKQLALRAVRDHLAEQPGVWLEPGHVHQRVRAMVRDRIQREPDEVRNARQEALAAKAAEDAHELAARKGIPSEDGEKFARRGVNPAIKVRCPWCNATPGQHCTIPRTNQRLRHIPFHPSRIEAAEQVSA